MTTNVIDLAAVRSRRAEQAAAREAVKADAIAKAQPQARACSHAPLEPVGLMETSEPVAPDEIRLLGEELLAEDHPASAPPTEEGAPIPPNSEIQARKPGHNSKAEAALSPGPAPTAFATIEPLTAEGAAV